MGEADPREKQAQICPDQSALFSLSLSLKVSSLTLSEWLLGCLHDKVVCSIQSSLCLNPFVGVEKAVNQLLLSVVA